jgi:HlyD family secretion protein
VGTGQMAGTEILRIADLSRMEVQVEVNENDIVNVNVGDTASIEIDSYLGSRFRGVVTEIANSANTTGASLDQVTSFNVKILILAESYASLVASGKAGRYPFRPGMTATVEIETQTKQDVLSIPIQAVTTRIDSTRLQSMKDPTRPGADEEGADQISRDEMMEVLFSVDNGVVSQRKIATGIQDKNFIEILSGVNENESVVIAPYNAVSKKLASGDKVQVVPKDELFRVAVKK